MVSTLVLRAAASIVVRHLAGALQIQAIFSAFLATGATSSTAAGSSTGGGGSLLPCVLVLSEGDGPGEAASRHAITRMLGTGIVDHPSTTVIELPPVPDTRMRKVLER